LSDAPFLAGQSWEDDMLEYDSNLPQSVGQPLNRARSVGLVAAFALGAVLLVLALVVLLPVISRYQI
jgi:hypothetical protein